MLVFIASLAVFVASIALAAAVKALPPAELKRQARADKKGSSASIYKLVSYGPSLDLLLGILVISSFIGSILAAAEISWWLVAAVFVASLLVWLKDPNGKNGKIRWSLAGYLAYPADWLLRILHPMLRGMTMVSRTPRRTRPHTRAYQKEDLLELLKHQARQTDNRITELDLNTARSALVFRDKTVADILTPASKLKFVSSSDSVGPHLMDELHGSGESIFPVVAGSPKKHQPEIIGTLNLNDLLGQSEQAKVKDVMVKKVYYINESQSLPEALAELAGTGQGLLIVVNNFKEIAGSISLGAVVKEILGDLPDNDFDRQASMDAAAGGSPEKSVVE